MFGALYQLLIQLFLQSTLPFEELDEYLVVDGVVGKQLFEGERALVGQRRVVDFTVLEGIFEFHAVDIYQYSIDTQSQALIYTTYFKKNTHYHWQITQMIDKIIIFIASWQLTPVFCLSILLIA